MLESAQDYAIFATDRERRVTTWSAGAERMFGYSESEIKGQPSDIIFIEEDRASGAPQAEAGEAIIKGRAEDERWHQRKNRERFYASGVMAPLRDAAGVQLGFVKIVRDLTERKLAQEALRKSRDELAQRVHERTRELQEANDALRAEIARRTAAEAARQQSLARVASAQEEERLRIAREMHDEVGQDIAALMLRLDALEPVVRGTSNAGILRDTQQLTETIGERLHALAVQLRPTTLEDLGLAGAISAFVESWSARSRVPVHLHLENVENPRLPPPIELALYRVAQEALTNVLKHAAASKVSLVIHRTQVEVVAMIEDDGRGFAIDEQATTSGGGLGLLGMQERIGALHGRLTLESQPGRGTSVLVRVPLKPV